MAPTCYKDVHSKPLPEAERVRHHCDRLSRKNLLVGAYPEAQRKVSLNSFLGLDNRGSEALLPLKNSVVSKNTDAMGDAVGHGPLGGNWRTYQTVDL